MGELISIIIPVFNVEQYLNRCIQSIVNQSYTNLEIILINDGSTDDSPEICDEWAKRDERITVVHKENAGVSEARNTGLDIATGEFISFMDSDDMMELDTFGLLVDAMNNYQVDLVTIGFQRTDDLEQKTENKSKKNQGKYKIFDRNEISNLIITENNLTDSDLLACVVWGKLFKRELINDLRFESHLTMSEDNLYTLNYILGISNACCILEKKYIYLQRSDSAMGKFTSKYIDHVYSYQEILKLEELFTESTCVHLKKTCINLSVNYIYNSLENNILNKESLNELKIIIKKEYRDIKNASKYNIKQKIRIKAAIYCPQAYIHLKKLEKRK